MTIKAATLDLELEQGATASYQFTLKHKTLQPFDLSGCTIRSQIKASIGDSLPLASFVGTIVDQYAGIFLLTLTKAESSKLNVKRAFWDAFLDTPDNQALKLFAGTVMIALKVTK